MNKTTIGIEDFSFNEDVQVDDYGDRILIQKFDVTLGNKYKFSDGIKRKIVVLCYNLQIDGEYIANSCDITIFCRNLICTNNAKIDVSGLDNKTDAGRKLSNCDGDHPDGANADNKGPDGVPLNLNGFDAGTVKIYADKKDGDLEIIAKGGNGAKGQAGGFACDGRDGLVFPAYKLYKLFKSDFLHTISTYPAGQSPFAFGSSLSGTFKGEDGVRPGYNGNGDIGGIGGNGGEISIFGKFSFGSLVPALYPDSFSIILSYGDGGEGGRGGDKPTKGGKGGKGGDAFGPFEHTSFRGGVEFGLKDHPWVTIANFPDNDIGKQMYLSETIFRNEIDGVDRSNEVGGIGKTGENGADGQIGNLFTNKENLELVNLLPSSFYRILLLEAEYQYINNEYTKARDIFEWIVIIKAFVDENGIQNFECGNLCNFLPNENLGFYEPLFDTARIYLNQINQNIDFFGNVTNYVSLLDQGFISGKINILYVHLVAFKKVTQALLSKVEKDDKFSDSVKTVTDNNTKRISELQNENIENGKKIEDLNIEISNRQNEVSNFKQRVLDKEQEFKHAVESANDGCDLKSALTTVTKLVSIGVAISSGIGTVGAAVSVLSDSASLIDDFKGLVGEKNPGFDLDGWNTVFNEGGDNSIVKRVSKIQQKGADFAASAKILTDSFNASDDKKNELIGVGFNPDNTEGFNKADFIKQMKTFIDKFGEKAKAYQDEVISYIDFCDLTNQKRLEFTSIFLSIIQNTSQMSQLNNANSTLFLESQNTDQKKIPFGTKILFLDSYVSAKKFFIKLLYLQNKALSYFTLEPTEFSAKFYKEDVEAFANDGIIDNEKILIDYLVNSGFGRSKEETIEPIVIEFDKYPISFESFVKGDDKGLHSLFFVIEPKGNILGDYKEVFVKTVRVRIPNVKTKKGNLRIDLEHQGNSQFIRTDNKSIFFSHKPVNQILTFKINANNEHFEFKSLLGDYLINGVQPYVEISPFANWILTIDEEKHSNDGLDLSEVKSIELDFEFYHNPKKN